MTILARIHDRFHLPISFQIKQLYGEAFLVFLIKYKIFKPIEIFSILTITYLIVRGNNLTKRLARVEHSLMKQYLFQYNNTLLQSVLGGIECSNIRKYFAYESRIPISFLNDKL